MPQLRTLFLVFASFALVAGCATKTLLSGPVAYYAASTGSELSENRSWPTIAVYAKMLGKEATLLAENVGKVGEFPLSFLVTPDKKRILLNLESKLSILDVETRELRDLFTPRKQVLGMAFSADEQRFMIWDQKYADQEDTAFFIHELNLDTGEAKTLYEGDTQGSIYIPAKLRDDNILLLLQSFGEASAPWFLDLNTKTMEQVPGHEEPQTFIGFSDHGKYLIVPDQMLDDECNLLFGAAPKSFSVVNPLTGERAGGFGKEGRHVISIAFSPDDEEVLFASFLPIENEKDCGQAAPPEGYYRMPVSGEGEPALVEDYQSLLAEWGSKQAGFDYNLLNDGGSILTYNGEEVLQLDEEMRLIGAFVL